jgi:hypothetical protein
VRPIASITSVALIALVACNGILAIEDRPLLLLQNHDAAVIDGSVRPGEDGGGVGDAPSADGPASSAYAAAVLADHPVAYFRLGEPSGAVAVNEIDPTKNGAYPPLDVVKLGAPGAILGESDTAVSFEGPPESKDSKAKMAGGVDLSGNKKFSIEVWVKASPNTAGNSYVIDYENHDSGRTGWDLLVQDTHGFVFERYGTPANAVAFSAINVADDAWHHLVATFNGTDMYLFVDGELAGNKGTTDNMIGALPPDGWSIGSQNCDCSTNHLLGVIDEVALYADVLTQQQIRVHYHASGRD